MSDASFNEQLLTALFDGELQGAERERAENLLAENSEYKQLFESWQTQSDAFRDLPSYRLDEGFAAAVLREVESQSGTDSVHASAAGAMSNWQSGFAAIATLAAMLLLTLFVFPNVFDNTPVANRSPETPPALKEDDSLTRTDEKSADADNLKAGKTGESGGDAIEKTELAKAKGGTQSRSGDDYANQQAKRLGKSGATNSLKRAALHSATRSKSADRDKSNVIEEISVAGNQANTVDQILWIDMQHREKPMADVEDIFDRNSIRLLNSKDAQLPGAGEGMNKLQTAQPNVIGREGSKMEALYVVATPTQMRQAIVELSGQGQAEIAGYQVPQNQVNQLVQGGQLAEANRAGQEADQGQAVQQQIVQSPADQNAGSAAAQIARGPVSSAQQLTPFQMRNSELGSSQTAAESEEIRQIDNWFQLPTRNSDTEMVHYLLFVQTGSADSFSRDSSDASMSEPDDGSADK